MHIEIGAKRRLTDWSLGLMPQGGGSSASAATYSEIGGQGLSDRKVQSEIAAGRRRLGVSVAFLVEFGAKASVTERSIDELPQGGGGKSSVATNDDEIGGQALGDRKAQNVVAAVVRGRRSVVVPANNPEFGARSSLTERSIGLLPQSGGGAPSVAANAEIGGQNYIARKGQMEIATGRGRRIAAPATTSLNLEIGRATGSVPNGAVRAVPSRRRARRFGVRPAAHCKSRLRARGVVLFGAIWALLASVGQGLALCLTRPIAEHPKLRATNRVLFGAGSRLPASGRRVPPARLPHFSPTAAAEMQA